ncbi:nucleoside-diphosphate sugar epimerase [Paenibacillus sp. NPDC056579]|uniref:nucleoside-diphosphate sugar epimerase n=1 Tax=unclassified Paenibacillus TaxID=185978 RepID=UPI001EF967C7|nr:nucleoside-diphosphate sugar epimerase [Paenibacillus sp. H1-7]ULL17960.1 nucleoside-diphosphate sugar epimerase [Paenibacillus sp. H1-7]
MQKQLTQIIEHMANSQTEMAKILESQRHIILHAAGIIHDIPHDNPSFGDIETLTDNALNVTKSMAAYLNSLADLEDTLADNLMLVLKEVEKPDGEE